jgi:hypothetical protein
MESRVRTIRFGWGIALILVLGVSAVASSATAKGGVFKSCGATSHPRRVYDVRAKGVGCAKAKEVASSWYYRGPPPGWHCRGLAGSLQERCSRNHGADVVLFRYTCPARMSVVAARRC